jgi:uncharacterized protein (TIGR02118 family)
MYPTNEGTTFDYDYYLNTHLKLVGEKWGQMGLQGARVLKGMAGGEPGSAPAFQVITVVDFESLEKFEAAMATHGDAVLGDIPNFTNAEPVLQINEPIA